MKHKQTQRKLLFSLVTIIFLFITFNLFKLNAYRLSWNQANAKDAPIEKVLTGQTIVIDAGHGGRDAGSIGQNETLEKDVTLKLVKQIESELKIRTGATIILTRDGDEKIELGDRVKIAEENNADLFVSIHFDAFFTNDAEGITTYYYKESDQQLASLIHEHLFKTGLEARNRGINTGDYTVLSENSQPSLLLELGYISNEKDEARINSEQFHADTAKNIVGGMIDYLSPSSPVKGSYRD